MSKIMSSTMDQSTASLSQIEVVEPTAKDFWTLLKPRLMSLVIFTAAVGLLLAPGQLHPVLAFTALLCIAVGAGASGCLNMWYDADIDAVMKRTQSRPIPAGRMRRETALTFGVVLSVTSVTLMGLMINVTAAALLAFTIGFYVFVYTMWLKRRTVHNTVIGGAAGALPPMIGWAAVTGEVGIESLVLFGIIFAWQPAHFWALSLFAAHDYEKAGVPMLPVVAGKAETRRQIMLYTILTVPLSLLPWWMGFAGVVYGVTAAGLGGLFLLKAILLLKNKDEQSARKMFFFSILYLFVLFAVMGTEALIGKVL